jgi:hypothetical protein
MMRFVIATEAILSHNRTDHENLIVHALRGNTGTSQLDRHMDLIDAHISVRLAGTNVCHQFDYGLY